MNKLLKIAKKITLENIVFGAVVSVIALAGTYVTYHIATDKDFPVIPLRSYISPESLYQK